MRVVKERHRYVCFINHFPKVVGHNNLQGWKGKDAGLARTLHAMFHVLLVSDFPGVFPDKIHSWWL